MELVKDLLIFLFTLIVWALVTTEVAEITSTIALILSVINLMIGINLFFKKR